MKQYEIKLNERDLELIRIALIEVGNLEIERETPHEERIGPECDELLERIQKQRGKS